MHTPYVRNYLTHDLYIAPLQLVPSDQLTPGTQIEMLEGETTNVKGVQITFNSLGMDRETGKGQRRESIVASALLTVKSDSIVYNLKPAIKLEAGERILLPDSISSPVLKFTITGMQVDKKIINLIVAAVSGASIPLLLKRFGADPALAGTVVLTTVTDIVGFLSFLGLATLYLL